MKDNILTVSLKLNKKQSPLDKLYNAISLTLGLVSLTGWLVFAVYLFFDMNTALLYFSIAFYFLTAFTLLGFFFCVSELLRNPYFNTILAAFLLSICSILIIATLISQFVMFKEIFIFPNIP